MRRTEGSTAEKQRDASRAGKAWRLGRRGRLALVGLLGIGLALPLVGRWFAGLWFGGRAASPQLAATLSEPASVSAPPPSSVLDAGLARDTIPDAIPRSLDSTEVDGSLMTDESGRFVPTPAAIALFDYFLTASGEESLPSLRARIVRHVRETLVGPAAEEAISLLERYLAHREHMRTMTSDGSPPTDLARRLQWIREARRADFGAELAETLFGEEERVVVLDLERREVLLDRTLSEEQRRTRLDAIDARLPEHVRESRRQVMAPSHVRDEVEAMRAAGATDAEVFSLRAREFGPEAAERLARLDAQRAAWRSRLDTYRSEREALLESAAASDPVSRDASLTALRERHFDEHERLRVRAADEAELRVRAQSGAPRAESNGAP